MVIKFFQKRPKTTALTGAAAALILAVPFIVQQEGESLVAYQDVGMVWTICHGETDGVKEGDVATKEQCDALTQSRVGQFMEKVDNLLIVEVAPETLAAHTSFAYNIGLGGYAKSQALKLTNNNSPFRGCEAMGNWYTAGGRDCRIKKNNCYGLINRRNAEIQLCMKGWQK